MKIPEAEFILNADGSIYHLALQPGQVAPLILTVGDQDRVARISRHFDRVEHRVRRREFVTHTGWLGRTRLSVVSTGIGPDNVDIVLNELDALFNLDFTTRQPKEMHTALTIIRLGTTGGLQADIPVDSLVLSEGAFGLDGLLQFYDAPALNDHVFVRALRAHGAAKAGWEFPVAPYFAEADVGLRQYFWTGFQSGLTATNPGFYGPQGRQLRAPLHAIGYLDMLRSFAYEGRRIVNLEMETAAILGLAHLLGHRAVSLSAVLANRFDGSFSKNPGRAVEGLIRLVLEKISTFSDVYETSKVS